MTSHSSIPQFVPPDSAVIAWLLDSDPAIRWQVLQDLLDAPADEVAAERAKVATEGMGAALLAEQDVGGTWAEVAWNRGWDSTMHVLMLLRDMGLDPASAQARHALRQVDENVVWKGWEFYEGNPFFMGEVEPCINGQMAAAGAYFEQDVRDIIERLQSEQLSDGGWNCEAPHNSRHASFHTTICVLEALLAYEQFIEADQFVTAARLRGEAYLLKRSLFRARSTGEVINPDWLRFAFPTWWHYDVLRGLEYFRRASATPDKRLAEAIALVESKRGDDGRWLLETRYPGVMLVEIDAAEGEPSRWNTLRALRVLKWYAAGVERTSRR